MAGGFFTNWAIKEPQVNLFPLDSEPGPFCMLGEHDNHHTTETMCSHQQMVLYPYIPLPSFLSSLGRRSWQMLFCFLKNSSSTSSTLAFLPHLPWWDNHMQNQNKWFNYKYLVFFFKERPLRMGTSERMDTLIYYKCEHFATVCLHSMMALGMKIF